MAGIVSAIVASILPSTACWAATSDTAAEPAAGSETLADAVALAYATNPTLQAQRAAQRAIDEEYVQAEAGLRPSVTVTAALGYDHNQLGIFGPTTGTSSFGGITVTQPLYSGGRVARAIDAAHADILAGRQVLRATEISVLQAVIVAYVDVRRAQAQQAIAAENLQVLSQEMRDTQARYDVGEVTRTDLAQSHARRALAEAQLASARATLEIARAGYASVVGRPPGALAPEPPIAGLLPAGVDLAFDAAEQSSPRLLAAIYSEQAGAARLAQAKAQGRPQVNLNGGLGYTGGQSSLVSTRPANPFVDYGQEVSVSANATWPIFTGGLLSSQVREAAARDGAARIGIDAARREVVLEISQAWSQLLGARANVSAGQAQVDADRTAYDGVRQEQTIGLRTTLDVLNAQQELEAAQLALVGAQRDEYVAAVAVLAATGVLDVSDFASDARVYDPAANLSHIRRAFGWTPLQGPLEAVDRVAAPGPSPARSPPSPRP